MENLKISEKNYYIRDQQKKSYNLVKFGQNRSKKGDFGIFLIKILLSCQVTCICAVVDIIIQKWSILNIFTNFDFFWVFSAEIIRICLILSFCEVSVALRANSVEK